MLDFNSISDADLAKYQWQQHEHLRKIRQKQDALVERIVKVFRPRRHDLLDGKRKGEQYGARVFTARPAAALIKHCYGFVGYMMSKAVPWIGFVTVDQKLMQLDEIKTYCQELAEQVLSAAKRSNLHNSTLAMALDAQSVGYGVMIPEYDIIRDRASFLPVHPRESFISDDWYGNPIVYSREFSASLRTIVEYFEKNNIPNDLLEMYERHPFNEYDIIYSVYPNKDYRKGGLGDADLPYMGVYSLKYKNEKHLLDKRGVEWFPIIWTPGKEPGWAYGTSISADCLTQALVLNKLCEKMVSAAHKAVEPPSVIHSNLQSVYSSKPGARVFSDDPRNEVVQPFFERLNWPVSDAQYDALAGDVDDMFFVKFFEMLSSGDYPQMTAYQVSRMMGEKAVLMSPIIDTFTQVQEQSIRVLIDIEDSAGRLPEMPQILQDEGGKVEILSLGPLAQLQRSLLKSKGTIDSLGLIQMVTNMFPNAALKIREMELIEEVTVAQGMSQKLHRSDAEIAEIQAAMQAKEAREERLDTFERVAKAVPSVAKDAIHPNSPLALMGVGGNL